jgi:hypothetical protein
VSKVAALLAITVAVTQIAAAPAQSSVPAQKVVVPKLVGRHESALHCTLLHRGLKLLIQGYVIDPTTDCDLALAGVQHSPDPIITSQSIRWGRRVRRGTIIKVQTDCDNVPCG